MLARLRFSGLAMACALLGGCTVGTVDQIPVAPTPRVIRLTVTPTSVTMIVGGSLPIVSSGGSPSNVVGAFAQYSDGSGRYVEAAWTSSDTSVVSVDGTTLTAVGRGTANVSAAFQGFSDDQQFVVLGGVAGNWAGTYVVEQCSGDSGAVIDGMCAAPSPGRQPGFAYVGATLPIAMELTVSGGNVTGTVSFGNLRVPVTGQDRGGGVFSLRGAVQGAVALNITHWDAQAVGDDMGGFIAYEMRFSGVNGTGSAASRLVNVTRR